MKKNKDERRLTSGEETKKSALSRKKYETSDERRSAKRVAQLSKQNERREARVVKYGSDLVGTVVSDFNKRFVAAFMALVFALSCLVVGVNFATQADEESATLTPTNNSESGITTSKTLSVNSDGSYDVNLSAYATGASITQQVPTDFVLVLDQSGSMSTKDMPTDYGSGSTRNWTIDTATASSYYYKDGENYYKVYAKRGYMYEYIPGNSYYIGDIVPEGTFGWFVNKDVSGSGASAYYYWNEDLQEYDQLIIKATWQLGMYNVEFWFYDSEGTYHKSEVSRPDQPWYRNVVTGNTMKPGWGIWPINYNTVNSTVKGLCSSDTSYTYGQLTLLNAKTGMFVDFDLYKRHVGPQQLCYRDADGVEHVLIQSDYCNSSSKPVGGACTEDVGPAEGKTSTTVAYWNGTLYPAGNTEKRIESLNKAAKNFIQTVAAQKNPDGTAVDHKIAIAGFASQNTSSWTYNNTELLTPDTAVSSVSSFGGTSLASNGEGYDGPQYYSGITDAQYKAALVSTASTEGEASLENSIDYITAYGGTQPEDGFDMAKEIFERRSDENKIYTKANGKDTAERNMVVIFFTDGQPGNYSNSNQYEEANDVVEKALEVKNLGATVYSIGVFGESDGNPLTYAKYSLTGRSYNITDTGSTGVTYETYMNYTGGSSDVSWDDVIEGFSYDSDYFNIINAPNLSYLQSYYGSYYFKDLLYRVWDPVDNQGSQPSDTIADYMETVSSKYPAAEDFVDESWVDGTSKSSRSDSADYETMIARVRHTSDVDKTKQYYYLASNSKSLEEAFTKIFESVNSTTTEVKLDTSHSLITDVIADEFELTDPVTVELKMQKGTQASSDVDPSFTDIVDVPNAVSYSWVKNDETVEDSPTQTLQITGFDFSDYYIAPTHGGYKLLITIKSIKPKSTAETSDSLVSNISTSGIYWNPTSSEIEAGEELTSVCAFPQPSISRHSYELEVGSANSSATVSATYQIVDSNGTELPVTALADVVVQLDSSRKKLTSLTDNIATWTNAGNGYTMYFENLPSGAQVQANITKDDTSGNYTYYLSSKDKGSEASTSQNFEQNFLVAYADSVFAVTSVANNHTVTLQEDVSGPYSSTDNTFSPTLILIPPNGTTVSDGATLTLATGVTLTGDATNNYYTGTISNIQGNGSTGAVTLSIPAGYTLKVSQDNSGTYYESPSISYSKSDGTSNNYTDSGIVIDDTTSIIISNASKDSIAPETGVIDSTNPISKIMMIVAGVFMAIALTIAVYTRKKKEIN